MTIRKILRFLWLLLCWGTLSVAVLAAVVGVYALYHINTRIRHHVLFEFEKRFPELDVAIGQVRLDESKGITISDLEFSVPGEFGRAERPLVHVDEMFLACPVTIQALYRRELPISKIVLRSPIVRLTRDADGGFSELQRFRTDSPSLQTMPVEIQNATLLYEDVRSHRAAPLRMTGINLTATPGVEEPESSDPDAEALPPKAVWRFAGTAGGEMFHQLNFEGSFEPKARAWEFYATCRQFYWSSDFLAFLKPEGPLLKNTEHQQTLESFQGRFDFGLSAVADPKSPLGCRFAVEGTLFQGSAVLYEIDRTLSELNARFRVTHDEITIEKLSGLGEAARLLLSYSQQGFLENRGATLSASIKGLDFDEDFVKSLHPFLNESTITLLKRFEYGGRTDLDTELSFQAGSWKPKFLALNLSDLAFSFREFPYKVERLTGNFHVDETATLTFNLVTRQGDPLRATITGEYGNVFNDPVGQVRIIGEQVPIDRKLMNSLPEEQRKVVASLRPAGKINADLLLKLPPNDAPLEKTFVIGLDNISVEYESFPYPLSKICGILRLDDDSWSFDNVMGNNGSAMVKCSGHLRPVTDGSAIELLINILADELPVDEQLSKALLDPQQRELLAGFQIKGKVDIDAQVRFRSDERRLNLCFSAVPGPGLSLQPVRFPYRIEDVQGRFFYENGNISTELLTANHRSTRIRTGLECRFSPDGAWRIRLSPLTIYQLVPDRDLLDAMPPNARGFHESLKMEKPYDMRGSLEFSKQREDQPLVAVWDVGLVLHQNSIHFGVPVKNLFGEVRLTGYAVDDAFRVAGDLNIDSATVNGYPISQLKGPFFFDGMTKNQLHLGQEAGKTLSPPAPEIPVPAPFRESPWFTGSERDRTLLGQFFDGTLFAKGLVILDENISYSIKTALIGSDLAKISRHLEPSAKNIAGTLNCRGTFYGNGKNLGALGGQGSIQLRNANIYEAPGMIRLLRELSIREINPNAGAFSSADIDFRLHGPQMRLDQLTFEGGAFHLTGDGEVRLDTRQMNLHMRTRLGNKRWQIPGVSDIIGGAGDQLVQLNVHGPLSDPTVTRVLIPEAQKVIRIIQGDETEEPHVATPQEQPSRLFQWKNRPF